MSDRQVAKAVVLDAGARYGRHPSWRDFSGDLLYIACEPDADEAERLERTEDPASVRVERVALDRVSGARTLHLLRHRGLSSFLKPDPRSECFRRIAPELAEIEAELTVATTTIDALARRDGLKIDFLKVDTEGTEHDVILGAAEQIAENVLGIRSSCNFQPCFFGQKLFSETHDYLLSHNFVLLNLDYFGFGYPRLSLTRKPDPTLPEDVRYGTLVACDAVWVRRADWLSERSAGQEAAIIDAAALKRAFFCLLNGAADVGLDDLRLYRQAIGRPLDPGIRSSRLFLGLRHATARHLGRWRSLPDQQWDDARSLFLSIFDEPLAGGSDFLPQLEAYRRALDAAS